MGVRAPFLRLLIPAAVLAGGCARPVATRPPEPPTVLVTRPVAESAAGVQTYTGTVRPRYETDTGFRVGGKLVTRNVEVGDRVTAGQVLAVLDPTDFDLAVKAAENDRNAAEATARNAAKEEERARRNRASGVISGSEYDTRRASLDTATEQLRKAERSLELARNRLSYCTLRAEVEGVVTGLAAEAGQVVAEGQWVVRVARRGEREAVVGVPEHRLTDLKSAVARVSLWSQNGTDYPAKLREVTPTADPVTRTYQVRFSLTEDCPAELGMTVTVHLHPYTPAAAVSVPLSAVTKAGEQPGVWVVDSKTGKLTLTPVRVREYRHDRAVLSGGLGGNEWVVRAGIHKLDPALTVRVREGQR
jgi:RND family efflux transporter MFP subunit